MFGWNKEKENLINKIEKFDEEIKSLKEENKSLEKVLTDYVKISDNLYNELIYQDTIIKDKQIRIEDLQCKTKIVKERNQYLEDLHINSTPKWNTNIDIALRINPKTKKPELYRIPKNIKLDKVEYVRISDDLKWVTFKYDDEKYKNKDFKIRWS